MGAWITFFVLTAAGAVVYVWAWRNREDVERIARGSVTWVERSRAVAAIVLIALIVVLDVLVLLDSIFDFA